MQQIVIFLFFLYEHHVCNKLFFPPFFSLLLYLYLFRFSFFGFRIINIFIDRLGWFQISGFQMPGRQIPRINRNRLKHRGRDVFAAKTHVERARHRKGPARPAVLRVDGRQELEGWCLHRKPVELVRHAPLLVHSLKKNPMCFDCMQKRMRNALQHVKIAAMRFEYWWS